MDNDKFQELMLQQFNKVFEKLDSLEKGQLKFETRMDSLDKGQSNLETRMYSLEKRQSKLETRMDSLEKGQSKLETRMDSLEKNQSSIKNHVDRLESKVDKLELRIENEVIEKIRALFDDRSMNQDYFSSIKDSLARIEDRLEFLAHQNIEHLHKLSEHDRELHLLRAERK